MRACADLLDFPKPIEENPFVTLSEPFLNQEQEQEQKQEKEKTLSGKPDAAAEILDYLNERAGKHFRSVKATVAQINARLKEASADEIRAVIDDRVKAWGRDEKMAEYLRPATLFAASNFANYLGNLSADDPVSAGQPLYFQGVRVAA